MTVDVSGAVLTAVTQQLAAHVTLAPVFSVPPEGTQPPVVVVGELNGSVTSAGKHDGMIDFNVRVTTIVGGTSRVPLFALMAEVAAALVNAQLTAAGVSISAPILTSTDDHMDGNNNVMVGDQQFLIFALPAS